MFLQAYACSLSGICLKAESTTVHPSFSVQERIRDIFSSSNETVVRVKATRKDTTKEKPSRVLKMGSGHSKEGHVLTTGLLRNADQIWIEHQESFYLAQLVGHDQLCNISMLKIMEPKRIFLPYCFRSWPRFIPGINPGWINLCT